MLSGSEMKGALTHCWWEYKWMQPLWKSERCFFTNLKFPYELAASLLGTYLKGSNPTYGINNCTSMFTVALFTIAKLLNQPRCPTTAEQVKKTQRKIFGHKEEWSSVILQESRCKRSQTHQSNQASLRKINTLLSPVVVTWLHRDT